MTKQYSALFKRLKNGKGVSFYYNERDNVEITINLRFAENKFQVNSYEFIGNDVMDESNYKNESTEHFITFNEMIEFLIKKYPTIKLQIF